MKLFVPLLTLASLVAPANAALIASWDLEEGTGNTTTERISGTVSDVFGVGVTWSSNHYPGSQSSFSTNHNNLAFGTNINSTIGFNGNGAKTIVFWFNANLNASATAEDYIFGYSPSNGATAGADLRIGINTAGALRFEANGGNYSHYSSGASLFDGNWHMAALVIEAGDTAQTVQWYLDGTFAGQTAGGGSTVLNTGTTGEIMIGTDGNASRPFSGLIDQVQIYNTALTKADLDGLQVVPEPSVALLGGLGLLGLLRRRR